MNRYIRDLLAVSAMTAVTFAATTVQSYADKEVITFAASPFAAARGPALEAWVKKFNDSQDAIEVKPVAIPFSSFANTMFTQMGGKGGPDLVRFDLQDFYPAAAANLIVPIDEVVSPDQKFRPIDEYLHVDGKRYGVAFEMSKYGLIYNKALLKDGKVPATFDEFLDAAKAATGNGVYGFAYRATMAESSGFWQDVCNFVFGFGGRWSDDGGNLTLNDPKVIDGITAYKTVYDLGVAPKGADAATFRRMFSEGKVAMEIDNSAVMASLKQKGPNLPIEVAPSPFPVRVQGMVLAPITVNANTKHKEAAFTFLKWLLQPENQKALEEAYSWSSFAATEVAYTPEELASRPWLAVFGSESTEYIPQLVFGQEDKTSEIQQIVLDKVTEVLQGGLDPKAAMDAAQEEAMRKVIRK